MLTTDQMKEIPRWKQTVDRYKESGDLRLKSGEDKLARRLAGIVGLRNADKKLYPWEAQHSLEHDPGTSLWQRVMVYLQVEHDVNTSMWRPVIAHDDKDAHKQCSELPEGSLAIIYYTRSDREAASYVLEADTYADDLPMPCRLWQDDEERVWITCQIKHLI
jgi:hypothetical protein